MGTKLALNGKKRLKGFAVWTIAGLLSASAASALLHAAPNPAALNGRYTATAYSTPGLTSSGEYTHRHVVAADPDILPIGTRIRVRRAGRYSGEYVVADTGEKIVGRRLDLFIPSTAECKKFGRKPVRVKVLALGDGTHQAARQADQAVKQDVAQDIAKGTVGHAATETDWAQKGGPTKAAVTNAAANPAGNPPGSASSTPK